MLGDVKLMATHYIYQGVLTLESLLRKYVTSEAVQNVECDGCAQAHKGRSSVQTLLNGDRGDTTLEIVTEEIPKPKATFVKKLTIGKVSMLITWHIVIHTVPTQGRAQPISGFSRICPSIGSCMWVRTGVGPGQCKWTMRVTRTHSHTYTHTWVYFSCRRVCVSTCRDSPGSTTGCPSSASITWPSQRSSTWTATCTTSVRRDPPASMWTTGRDWLAARTLSSTVIATGMSLHLAPSQCNGRKNAKSYLRKVVTIKNIYKNMNSRTEPRFWWIIWADVAIVLPPWGCAKVTWLVKQIVSFIVQLL